MAQPAKILIAEDEAPLRNLVRMSLEAIGHQVVPTSDGAEALAVFAAQPFDLVILDVMMPQVDGFDVCREIRARSDVPIIMLTALDSTDDMVRGFELGADDYIAKPFSQRLLTARIHAILRRNDGGEARKTGFLSLDDARHLCAWKEKPVDVTVTEFLILKSLAEHPGQVKTREQLIDFAYGDALDSDDRTIDSHIKRIRKKFKDADPEFDNIESVYGLGYRYKND